MLSQEKDKNRKAKHKLLVVVSNFDTWVKLYLNER